MNKKKLITCITKVLHENNARKPVSAQKTILHISDNDGNNSDFVIKKNATGLLFTERDVTVIIDALIAVIEDSIKRGEEISIHGFGTFGTHYRAARQTKHPESGEIVDIKPHYIPKFTPGKNMKLAAKIYDLSLDSKAGGESLSQSS